MIVLEVFENYEHKLDLAHVVEFVVYVAFLVVIGVLIEWVLRMIRNQNTVVEILDHKHKIGQDIITHDSWDELTAQLVKYPASVAPVDKSLLSLKYPISEDAKSEIHWVAGETDLKLRSLSEQCEQCKAGRSQNRNDIIQCGLEISIEEAGQGGRVYCLPIQNSGEESALLRFRLKPGETLSNEQSIIIQSLADDYAIAIQAGQDRKKIGEFHKAEVSLAERRKMSMYLHDSLGQNLGFLNFKLDQLLAEKDFLTQKLFNSDLERMRAAATESNSIVRSFLESSRPETLPVITNLLIEHGKHAAERANYQINFNIHGNPVDLAPDVQRAVFYVFLEVLNNVEKHARASRVDVQIDWCSEKLSVVIMDNGIGFLSNDIDPNKHFGLGIMQERILAVNGEVNIASAENAGTKVLLSVPLSVKSVNPMTSAE